MVVVKALTLRVGRCCCVVCNENHGGQFIQLAFPKKRQQSKLFWSESQYVFKLRCTRTSAQTTPTKRSRWRPTLTSPDLPRSVHQLLKVLTSMSSSLFVPLLVGCNLLNKQCWSGKRPSLQARSDHEETSRPGKFIFLSMFSSLHLLQTKTLNCQIAEGGGELGVHQYLIIFLKFVQVYLVIIYLYVHVYQFDRPWTVWRNLTSLHKNVTESPKSNIFAY